MQRPEQFERMTCVGWRGVYFCSQYAAKRMIAKNIKGLIINVSSNQAEAIGPRSTIYGPTKAAVSKFTKNAAMELSLHGIRMVAIAPGYTDIGWPADSHLREARDRLPLKRFAQPGGNRQGCGIPRLARCHLHDRMHTDDGWRRNAACRSSERFHLIHQTPLFRR